MIYFNEIDDTGHDFDDATTWHDDVDNIYIFFMMIHMRIFTLVLRVLPVLYDDDYITTRPLWTDLWRDRI